MVISRRKYPARAGDVRCGLSHPLCPHDHGDDSTQPPDARPAQLRLWPKYPAPDPRRQIAHADLVPFPIHQLAKTETIRARMATAARFAGVDDGAGPAPPLSGKLSRSPDLKLHALRGEMGWICGVLSREEGGGSDEDAAAEQRAARAAGERGRDQPGHACEMAGRGAGEGAVSARRQCGAGGLDLGGQAGGGYRDGQL